MERPIYFCPSLLVLPASRPRASLGPCGSPGWTARHLQRGWLGVVGCCPSPWNENNHGIIIGFFWFLWFFLCFFNGYWMISIDFRWLQIHGRVSSDDFGSFRMVSSLSSDDFGWSPVCSDGMIGYGTAKATAITVALSFLKLKLKSFSIPVSWCLLDKVRKSHSDMVAKDCGWFWMGELSQSYGKDSLLPNPMKLLRWVHPTINLHMCVFFYEFELYNGLRFV